MLTPQGPVRNAELLRRWWQQRTPRGRRLVGLLLAVWAACWLSGAAYAPGVVAGLQRLEGGARLLMALSMGGFGWLWGGLKAADLLDETTAAPHLLWIPLALALPTALYLAAQLLDREAHPAVALRQRSAELARSQGQVTAEELAVRPTLLRGVPFVSVAAEGRGERSPLPFAPPGRRLLGLTYPEGEGHVLVTAPTRAGKGLHLTATLLTWPGPALVVDPKGEQYRRTAGARARLGPVYRLPGHSLPLAEAYGRLLDRDATAELHAHLLRPWESRETIFADKALALFTAAGLYARAHGLDPLRVLLDLAESDPVAALTALEREPAVRRHVRVFTNGAPPAQAHDDKFVTSALGNFTTRLATYQAHIEAIAPQAGRPQVGATWRAQRGTVYVTYGLQELRGAGGVVAALVGAVLRTQATAGRGTRLLAALDELPALGLRNLVDYLATAGGDGVTLLLYVQSIGQLRGLYGADGTRALLANCAHQLWYPPADWETAEQMAQLRGVALTAQPGQSAGQTQQQRRERDGRTHWQSTRQRGLSWTWQERPLQGAAQALALGREQVLVTTTAGGAGREVYVGERLNPLGLLERLPPPPAELERLPPEQGERVYLAWETLGVAGETPATPARADGSGARERPAAAAPPTASQTTASQTTAPQARPEDAQPHPGAARADSAAMGNAADAATNADAATDGVQPETAPPTAVDDRWTAYR